MKKTIGLKLALLLSGACLLLATQGVRGAMVPLSGDLRWSDSEIVATDGWQDNSTYLSWNVTLNAPNAPAGLPILYEYEWNTSTKALSHIIIEVSGNTTAADFSAGILDTYSATSQGNSNPGLVGSIYGLKFGGGSTHVSFSFYSNRLPTYGDFYAKDGVQNPGHIDVTAWNSGWDGSSGVWDGTGTPPLGKLVVPDTVVPETSTMIAAALLGLPVVVNGWRVIRNRRKV